MRVAHLAVAVLLQCVSHASSSTPTLYMMAWRTLPSNITDPNEFNLESMILDLHSDADPEVIIEEMTVSTVSDSDDSPFENIELGFAFPYYGDRDNGNDILNDPSSDQLSTYQEDASKMHSSVRLSPNGDINLKWTLPCGETFLSDRCQADQNANVISVLNMDLQPSYSTGLNRNNVRYSHSPSMFSAIWDGVPRYGLRAEKQTVGASLFPDGRVEMYYGIVDLRPEGGLRETIPDFVTVGLKPHNSFSDQLGLHQSPSEIARARAWETKINGTYPPIEAVRTQSRVSYCMLPDRSTYNGDISSVDVEYSVSANNSVRGGQTFLIVEGFRPLLGCLASGFPLMCKFGVADPGGASAVPNRENVPATLIVRGRRRYAVCDSVSNDANLELLELVYMYPSLDIQLGELDADLYENERVIAATFTKTADVSVTLQPTSAPTNLNGSAVEGDGYFARPERVWSCEAPGTFRDCSGKCGGNKVIGFDLNHIETCCVVTSCLGECVGTGYLPAFYEWRTPGRFLTCCAPERQAPSCAQNSPNCLCKQGTGSTRAPTVHIVESDRASELFWTLVMTMGGTFAFMCVTTIFYLVYRDRSDDDAYHRQKPVGLSEEDRKKNIVVSVFGEPVEPVTTPAKAETNKENLPTPPSSSQPHTAQDSISSSPTALGSSEVSSEYTGSDENLCSICICDFEVGESIMSLKCKHQFHTECLTPWLDKSTLCPLCKGDIRGPQFTATRSRPPVSATRMATLASRPLPRVPSEQIITSIRSMLPNRLSRSTNRLSTIDRYDAETPNRAVTIQETEMVDMQGGQMDSHPITALNASERRSPRSAPSGGFWATGTSRSLPNASVMMPNGGPAYITRTSTSPTISRTSFSNSRRNSLGSSFAGPATPMRRIGSTSSFTSATENNTRGISRANTLTITRPDGSVGVVSSVSRTASTNSLTGMVGPSNWERHIERVDSLPVRLARSSSTQSLRNLVSSLIPARRSHIQLPTDFNEESARTNPLYEGSEG